jgi:Uma2 family endonuclease
MIRTTRESFDPLVDLYGLWTTAFAERYLPIKGAPPVKYECVDGKLIMSPYEAAPSGYTATKFGRLTGDAADAADLRLYGTVNVQFTTQRWIQPDFTVVRRPADSVWVPAADVELVGEFMSPSSRRQDRIDKPALCAAAGVPYYMLGKVNRRDKVASLRLLRLTGEEYHVVAEAEAGGLFEVDEPFAMSFDPVQLLDL